jgi:hypothetical protein
MTVRKFYLLRLDLSVSDARIRAQSECCRSYQCVRFQRRRAYTRVYARSLSGAYGVLITCQRGSARQCCKGHVSFLWEKPIFDPSQKPNPLSYNHKNLHD